MGSLVVPTSFVNVITRVIDTGRIPSQLPTGILVLVSPRARCHWHFWMGTQADGPGAHSSGAPWSQPQPGLGTRFLPRAASRCPH